MDTLVEDEFDKAKAAGLTPHDIARALNLNRVTVSLWYNGHAHPHKILKRRVVKLLDAINAAVEAGDLPISKEVTRRERGDVIFDALRRHGGVETENDLD